MVRHIVLWNLKETAEGKTKAENAAIIKERLEALAGQIDGLLKAEVTVNYNPKGMDLCLYSEFADKAARSITSPIPCIRRCGNMSTRSSRPGSFTTAKFDFLRSGKLPAGIHRELLYETNYFVKSPLYSRTISTMVR